MLARDHLGLVEQIPNLDLAEVPVANEGLRDNLDLIGELANNRESLAPITAEISIDLHCETRKTGQQLFRIHIITEAAHRGTKTEHGVILRHQMDVAERRQ